MFLVLQLLPFELKILSYALSYYFNLLLTIFSSFEHFDYWKVVILIFILNLYVFSKNFNSCQNKTVNIFKTRLIFMWKSQNFKTQIFIIRLLLKAWKEAVSKVISVSMISLLKIIHVLVRVLSIFTSCVYKKSVKSFWNHVKPVGKTNQILSRNLIDKMYATD